MVAQDTPYPPIRVTIAIASYITALSLLGWPDFHNPGFPEHVTTGISLMGFD